MIEYLYAFNASDYVALFSWVLHFSCNQISLSTREDYKEELELSKSTDDETKAQWDLCLGSGP